MEEETRLIREAMRALARRRKRTIVLCDVCGRDTPPSYATVRYCSNACRQRAKRARAQKETKPDAPD